MAINSTDIIILAGIAILMVVAVRIVIGFFR